MMYEIRRAQVGPASLQEILVMNLSDVAVLVSSEAAQTGLLGLLSVPRP